MNSDVSEVLAPKPLRTNLLNVATRTLKLYKQS